MCLGYVFGRRTPGDPAAANCQRLTKELADAVIAAFGSCCCGQLIGGFSDLNDPARKDRCCDIVAFCVRKTAEIIQREQRE
jgi:hypothetical protein